MDSLLVSNLDSTISRNEIRHTYHVDKIVLLLAWSNDYCLCHIFFPLPPCLFCFVLFFVFVCFTRYLVFCIAVLSHRPGVVYYHLLLRRETRIPGVAPFSFRIGIWDLFVHRGQKSYTPTAFGKLWTTPGVRCMKHASS